MEDENIRVSIKRPCARGYNNPEYLIVTKEQLILLEWLEREGWIELNQNDIPPEQTNLAELTEKIR